MKEELKKEEIKKENNEVNEVVQDSLINENKIEEVVEDKPSYRKLKSFTLVNMETVSGAKYATIEVKTYKDSVAKIRLSEGQAEAIKEVGLDNCWVDVESRYSDKARKYYDVIALHIDELATFDLFARDRGFTTVAKLHAKKYFGY